VFIFFHDHDFKRTCDRIHRADRLAHPGVITCQWIADNCLSLMKIKSFVWAGQHAQPATIASIRVNDGNGSFFEGWQGQSPDLKKSLEVLSRYTSSKVHSTTFIVLLLCDLRDLLQPLLVQYLDLVPLHMD
jgi:hypothetical protein